MKAIKIFNIKWNLNEVANDKKEEVLENLPTTIGSIVKDEFVVVEKIPNALYKKFGYQIETFSFEEHHIVESVEQMLDLCASKEDKGKNMFTPSGKLSHAGKRSLEAFKANVLWRVRLEKEGKSENEMPGILDAVMLGLEKITGLDWEKDGYNALMAPALKKIRDHHDDESSIMAGFEDPDEDEFEYED